MTKLSKPLDLKLFQLRPFRLFVHFLCEHLVLNLSVVISVLVAVFFAVSTDYALKTLIDSLAALTLNSTSVWNSLVLLLLCISIDNFSWRLAGVLAAFAFIKMTGSVRQQLFTYILKHSQSYFAHKPPGVLSARITATSNALFTIETMVVFNMLPPILATVGSILYVSTVSSLMSGVLLCGFIIVFCIMLFTAMRGRHLHHEYAKKAAIIDGEVVDVINNITLVRVFDMFKHEVKRFHQVLSNEMKSRLDSLIYIERIKIIHAITVVIGVTLLLYWVITLRLQNLATNGQVVLVTTLGIRILSCTKDLALALVDFTQHWARYTEALEAFITPYEIEPHEEHNEERLIKHHTKNSVEFCSVSFAYPNEKPLFQNLNLAICKDEKVVIMGDSGSGKSTLFLLMQKFYSPQSGHIRIEGYNLDGLSRTELAQLVTFVPQEPLMFHRTLRENLCYSNPKAGPKDIERALCQANCDDFVSNLPQGLDTVLGDRALRLSGGQRQRIAIARAILKDTPIILLDEVTSALDVTSAGSIRETIQNIKHKTIITITHDLAFKNDFDRIITLSKGEIVP